MGKTTEPAKKKAPVKKRKCHGENLQGKPCGANPLKAGTVIDGTKAKGKHCRAHDPDLPETARIQGAQPGAGRPKNPRVVDVMRDRVERKIEQVLGPYFDALEGAVVHATFEGEVIPSAHPDLGARIAAAEKLLDRVYGKPGQAIELTGKDGGPVEINEHAFDDPKVRKAADDLAKRLGSAREK